MPIAVYRRSFTSRPSGACYKDDLPSDVVIVPSSPSCPVRAKIKKNIPTDNV